MEIVRRVQSMTQISRKAVSVTSALNTRRKVSSEMRSTSSLPTHVPAKAAISAPPIMAR